CSSFVEFIGRLSACAAIRHYALHPILVFQVPGDSFANSLFERVARLPIELAFDLACVDRIATVVPEPILDERNEQARLAASSWLEFVTQVANQLDDSQVGPLVVSANVIGLPLASPRQDQPECFGMITHIKPVPNVQ